MITSEQQNFLTQVQQNLHACIPVSTQTNWEHIISYALSMQGQALRSLLTHAFADKYGLDTALILRPAQSLELAHSYSLIHDDLPAMDNADLRRGKKTLHVLYDDATAILVGDVFLTHALGSLAEDSSLSPEAVLRLIQALTKAIGSSGMILGQFLDLKRHHQDSYTYIQQINDWKTGQLFAYACAIPALILGTDPKQDQDFGLSFGRFYQIYDDYMDLMGMDQAKTKNQDYNNNKLTKAHEEQIRQALREAEQDLQGRLPMFPNPKYIQALISKLSKDLTHVL